MPRSLFFRPFTQSRISQPQPANMLLKAREDDRRTQNLLLNRDRVGIEQQRANTNQERVGLRREELDGIERTRAVVNQANALSTALKAPTPELQTQIYKSMMPEGSEISFVGGNVVFTTPDGRKFKGPMKFVSEMSQAVAADPSLLQGEQAMKLKAWALARGITEVEDENEADLQLFKEKEDYKSGIKKAAGERAANTKLKADKLKPATEQEIKNKFLNEHFFQGKPLNEFSQSQQKLMDIGSESWNKKKDKPEFYYESLSNAFKKIKEGTDPQAIFKKMRIEYPSETKELKSFLITSELPREVKQDLLASIELINSGKADQDKEFRRLAAKHNQYAGKLKTIMRAGASNDTLQAISELFSR